MAKKRRKGKKPAVPAPSSSWRLPLDRVAFYGMVFLVFALPLFIWPGISEYGYGKTIVAMIGISLLMILWGVSAWQKRSWTIRLPWIAIPILALIVAALFSLLSATNGRVVVQSLILVLYFALFLILVANLVRDQRDVNTLLFALLAAGFFTALYGLLQYLGVMRGVSDSGGISNIISSMGNRNYLGGFLSYLLFPAVVLVVRPRSRWVRLASILLIAFCFGTLLILRQTGTSVALIATALALLVGGLIFRPIEPIRRNRIWLIALLGVLVLTFLIEAPSGPLNSVVGLSDDGSSWISRWWQRNSGSVRSWDWWVGWEMFADHPVTGVGLGNYKLDFLPYKAAFLATPRGEAYTFYIPRAAQAHNDYVQVLAELGLLGSLAVVFLIMALLVSLWRRLRLSDETNRLDLLLFSCGIATYLIHALVSFPAHLPSSSLILVLVGGLVFSRVHGESTVFTVRISGRRLYALLAAVTAVGLTVSIIAGRDLAANVLMTQGIEQAQIGNPYRAESLLERSIALDFAPRQSYFHLSQVQLELGKIDEATANLERCLTRFVDESVYLNYANLMANAGEYDRAREAVDVLLSTYAREEIRLRARYLEAMITAQEGDPREATILFEALTEDAPWFHTGFVGLGTVFQARGYPVNARNAFEEALRLIDERLVSARAKIDGGAQMTAQQYGSLRTEIAQLEHEREAVLQRLQSLPPS